MLITSLTTCLTHRLLDLSLVLPRSLCARFALITTFGILTDLGASTTEILKVNTVTFYCKLSNSSLNAFFHSSALVSQVNCSTWVLRCVKLWHHRVLDNSILSMVLQANTSD